MSTKKSFPDNLGSGDCSDLSDVSYEEGKGDGITDRILARDKYNSTNNNLGLSISPNRSPQPNNDRLNSSPKRRIKKFIVNVKSIPKSMKNISSLHNIDAYNTMNKLKSETNIQTNIRKRTSNIFSNYFSGLNQRHYYANDNNNNNNSGVQYDQYNSGLNESQEKVNEKTFRSTQQ